MIRPIERHWLSGCAALMAGVMLSMSASAHIKNEASQFPDIEFSDARFDIVVLVGAGIIPETPVFEPEKTLSMRELATWAALGMGLLPGGETPDVQGLARAALETGLVDSLEGDATLADLNLIFFGGTTDVDSPQQSPSKADAAEFIASNLDSDAGLELLGRRGLSPGAAGEIASVETREGHHGSIYVITIDGVSLPMDEHGRVANGPTDLLQWGGRTVRRSFVRGEGETANWIYIEAEPLQSAQAVEAEVATEQAMETAPPASRNLLYWLIAGVLVLGVLLFFRRRRRD